MGGTAALPVPDASGSINMSASHGKVALVSSTTALSVDCPSGGSLVDLVGYGSADCYKGSGPAPGLNNTTSDQRNSTGCADTSDNAADFTAVACDSSNPPRNSSTAENPCACQ